MSAGRIWSIVIVALLHAVLGYAFVSGLAMRVIEEAREDLKTFDVEEPPPPEEEPPPPPPDQPTQPPPISAPPVLNRVVTQPTQTAPPPPPQSAIPNYAPPAPQPAPPGPPPAPPPPPPPPPPPRQAARAPQHRSGSISDEDYPASAIRAEAQGTTTIRMTVGADGRVTGCTVARSSGNSALDSTACSLAQRRFRFTPAQDTNGNNVAGTSTRSITWRLPEE
jgi:protein TonB